MKFVLLGNKSVRADRVETVQIFADAVTIYCIGGSQYTYHYKSQNEAKLARDHIIAELEKVEIRA